jgi:hypothetical protein
MMYLMYAMASAVTCSMQADWLHQRAEVMNPREQAALGSQAGNLTQAQRHRDFGLSLEGADSARPANPPPLL